MRISLNGDDWLFKDFVGEDWVWRNSHKPGSPDARWWRRGRAPGSVQYDLWQLGEIPDPYYERNSLLIEWVPERTWLYKKTFNLDETERGKRVQLHFVGVDYEAQFFLNGELLGRHQGMYTPAVFEVSDRLRYGAAGDNLIAVVIEPAPHEQPQVGRSSLVRTHKARMNYWWDFCPRMVHLGIWDDVYLDVTGAARIEDVFVQPHLADDSGRAGVPVTIVLSSTVSVEVEVEIVIRYQGDAVAVFRSLQPIPEGQSELHAGLEVSSPHLWWPNGANGTEGEQPLYEADVLVTCGGPEGREVSDRRQVSFGIRRVEMAPNDTPDPTARPYTFVVNGRKLYAKGWNWTPIDVLYGVPRPEKLKRLIELAKRAHVNLLRVWGGGLIEKEAFYELCDRNGIMVWQEFIQSSSGIENRPPDDPRHITMMVREAEQIIPRKRNHPSLVIWCGGNELQKDREQPCDDDEPLLAALRDTVRRLDPDRIWLPTSSSGRVFSNSLENIARDPLGLHDVHGPWQHQGLTDHYTLYNQGTSLFHSEFGVEGCANLKTIYEHTSPENRWPANRDNPVWFHTAAWWIKEATMEAAFGPLSDLQTTVHAGQFLQAEGLAYAVEAGRRRKYRNSGTLPWQFNEPYPNLACTSAVDYHARPKPAYYAVARVYRPLHVSARFPTLAWAGRDTFEAEISISDSWGLAAPRSLCCRLVGTTGKVHRETDFTHIGQAGGSEQAGAVRWPIARLDEEVFFLDLQLLAENLQVLASNRYLFSRTQDLAPLLTVPPTHLVADKQEQDDCWTVAVTNAGGSAAMQVWLEDRRDLECDGYAYFEDNYFSLLPGEKRMLQVQWHAVPPAERCVEIGGWNTGTLVLS